MICMKETKLHKHSRRTSLFTEDGITERTGMDARSDMITKKLPP